MTQYFRKELTAIVLILLIVVTTLQQPLWAVSAEEIIVPNSKNQDKEWERVDKATKKAVEYLLKQQNSDGSIIENDRKRKDRHQTTMTAFAIMGMLSVGNKPADETPAGLAMRKALDYVLRSDRVDKNGYFGDADQSRMYGHGIITLMLAEVMGMGADDRQDKLIGERLKKAVELILKAQGVEKKNAAMDGGWRYSHDATDSDLSVTSWQLIALRAAKSAGIEVPKEAIDRGLGFLRACYRPEESDKSKGHFNYHPGETKLRFGSSAGGFCVMQICGEYDAPEVKGSADFFFDHDIASLKSAANFYYGLYYYAQGMFQRGGKYAVKAQQVIRDLLLDQQLSDGSWELLRGDHESGKAYVTSLAMLSLSIHYHFLPIYQK